MRWQVKEEFLLEYTLLIKMKSLVLPRLKRVRSILLGQAVSGLQLT